MHGCLGALASSLYPVPIGFKALLVLVVSIFIIFRPQKSVRQILLGKPVVGRVVGLLVKLPFAGHLGAVIMFVLQVPGDGTCVPCLYICQGGGISIMGGI